MAGVGEVTGLLRSWSEGDRAAGERLIPLIYDELHRIAARARAGERDDLTLDTTDLIHDAYLKLIQQRNTHWESREHFFALAATVIRRLLIDHARARLSAKRDRKIEVRGADLAFLMSDERAEELVQLDEALVNLAQMDQRQARVVELKYFGGMSLDEISHCLEISPATVKRDWRTARAWLYRAMNAQAQRA